MTPLAALVMCLTAATVEVTRVDVTWRGGQDAFGATGVGYVLGDEDVMLGVLVHHGDGTCSVAGGVYRDAAGVDHSCARPMHLLGDWRAQYWRLRPQPAGGYTREPFAALRADKTVLMTFVDDDAEPLGTMRFGVTITDAAGNSWSSAGEEAPRDALRMVVRLDDGFLGILWELANVPVVERPRGAPPQLHDTELQLGVDPNSAVIYAARRLGLPLAYVDVVDQPMMTTLPVGEAVPRRGDVLVKGAREVGVLMAPSLAADAPMLTVTPDGLRVAQVGKLPPHSTVRRFVDLPRALVVPAPRQVGTPSR